MRSVLVRISGQQGAGKTQLFDDLRSLGYCITEENEGVSGGVPWESAIVSLPAAKAHSKRK